VFHDVFRQLDAAVAPSRYLADTFLKFGFPGVEVSPLGMPPITPLPKKPHNGIVFGFVGQIIARKGVEVLLDAFATIDRPDVSLEIWGKSTDATYLDRIVRRIARTPRVRYNGGYAPEQLPSIFADLDVAVVPSFMENYPLVVQESFMNGTPVIASRAGGIPEVLTHGRNGLLFTTGSADDLARQLRTIVEHPATIDALRANIPPTRTIADDATFYAAMYQKLAATAGATARDLGAAEPIGAR
jgi:glycosyltransferase involved in cell wall biosynthesis